MKLILTQEVAGLGGVPADSTAVVMNVTAVILRRRYERRW